MKITASGGTDGASIVLFWPNHLPDDFDETSQDDPLPIIEGLRDEGKLIWFPCDGDGTYRVSIFVRTPLPDTLQAVCKQEECIPLLAVKGEGFFGGLEYVFKTDRTLVEKYPSMLQPVAIPEGAYAATVYRTDVPDAVYETWLEDRAGRGAKRLWYVNTWLAAAAVIGALATVVGACVLSWAAWYWVAEFAALSALAAIGLHRTPACQAVRQAKAEYEEEFPDYIVHLAELAVLTNAAFN